jgi:hypothetical protein
MPTNVDLDKRDNCRAGGRLACVSLRPVGPKTLDSTIGKGKIVDNNRLT